MLRAYKYRLLPSEEQKQILANWFGTCRFIYNLGLETKVAAWASNRTNITCFDLTKQLTALRKEHQWIKDCPQQSLESVLTNLDNAYTKFFKGGGFPKFKKRSSIQSITFRRDSVVKDSKIKLTKIGFIDFIEHRKLPEGEIRTVTVTKTPTDKYFVSILLKDNSVAPNKKKIKPSTTTGVDLGLKTFAALSDGTKFDNPKYLHQQLKRLRIEQRTLARRYKKGVKKEEQSKGWHKQLLVVAKLHEKIKNQRADFLHKLSTSIIKKYDTVCMEDLNVAGMLKNSRLSKSISDVGWSEFNRMLVYKAEWHGKNIIYIGRFDPSSKICSKCGNIFKELKLSDREWTCEKCGTHHDRDENAAKNIKNFGLKAKPSTVKTSR